MGETNFNRRQCARALIKLDFYLDNKRSGSHDKYRPPVEIQKHLKSPQPPFIMVPRHSDLHCQNEILAELMAMGGAELVKEFKRHL